MSTIKRRTHCTIQRHGTRCEAAQEKSNNYCKTTEKKLAIVYELAASCGR